MTKAKKSRWEQLGKAHLAASINERMLYQRWVGILRRCGVPESIIAELRDPEKIGRWAGVAPDDDMSAAEAAVTAKALDVAVATAAATSPPARREENGGPRGRPSEAERNEAWLAEFEERKKSFPLTQAQFADEKNVSDSAISRAFTAARKRRKEEKKGQG